MQLVFMSREAYADKQAVMKRYRQQDWYWVNEGGYGHKGVLGAMEMLQQPGTASYTHIVCACGTGTTVAGLMAAALPHQQCIGISVLKGHHSLNDEVMGLLEHSAYHQPPVFFHDYHFGGYAKHPPELIEWMNGFWRATEIPTDIVYTGKLFYAVKDLVEKNYFLPEHKLLVVHSGGLQGNRSLPAGTLEFL
jgi:1-aminocyclopropane-1-carboxylate deaminase